LFGSEQAREKRNGDKVMLELADTEHRTARED